MRVLISDTSALIDLRKVHLIEAFLSLPYDFLIPDVILELELRSFSEDEIDFLEQNATVSSLTSQELQQVHTLIPLHQALSEVDIFVLVTARKHPDAILLTGDHRLRGLAEQESLEVHGVLWVIEELAKVGTSLTNLQRALEFWRLEPACRIPIDLIRETEARVRLHLSDK